MIVAFREHPIFNGFKHLVVQIFGLVSNLARMRFDFIGPCSVSGMRWHEPYIALGGAALWGAYGWIYFAKSKKSRGKAMILTAKPAV